MHNEHNELSFDIKLKAKILVGGFEKQRLGRRGSLENVRGKFDCII